MTTASKLVRIIGALALALAGLGLGGCSAVKLGYNNLPELAGWWLDGYFDFNDTQQSRARDDLRRLQQWHRTQELPRYAALLQKVEQQAAGDFSAAQACEVYDDARTRIEALAAQAEPSLTATALTLTPAQLQHLARRYDRSNEDFRKDWLTLSPAERRERRYKQFYERLETVYGRLDDGQRATLRRLLDASVFDATRVLAERQRRQQDTLQVLRQLQAPGVAAAEARRQMQGLLARSLASPDPAYRRLQDSLVQETCALAATMHAATSAEQRQHAARRLRGWQRDAADLAAQK